MYTSLGFRVFFAVKALGLGQKVVWYIPEKYVAVVTAGDQAVLTVIVVLRELVLGRELAQKDRLVGFSLHSMQKAINFNLYLSFLLLIFRIFFMAMLSLALSHRALNLVFHVNYHLLLVFISSQLHLVLLQVCVALISNVILKIFSIFFVCTYLVFFHDTAFVFVVRLQIVRVMLDEEMIKPDALDKVAMASTSHDRD
jgi:hypothetical protein